MKDSDKTEKKSTKTIKKSKLDFKENSEQIIKEITAMPVKVTLYLIIGLLITLVFIAYLAEIDQVAVADGKVVSSSHLQVLQNLEGGIVNKIHVKESDQVKKGQVLINLDDTRFAAAYKQDLTKKAVLETEKTRLSAEINNAKTVEFSPQLMHDYPQLVADAKRLFGRNQAALNSSIAILEKNYKLTEQELKIIRPLAKKGVMSHIDRIRLERQLNTIKGQLLEKHEQIIKAARNSLNKVRAELAILNERITATRDQMQRTVIRSPIDGVVHQIYVSTVGEVVKPGMKIMEVAPIDKKITIQAFVTPSNIGFIKPKQNAEIKFTAYNYTIYGGLKGKVKTVSPDASSDDKGNSYYEVKIQTDKNYLDKEGIKYPIIPGMVVKTYIITGKQSLLNYILQPFIRAKHETFKE